MGKRILILQGHPDAGQPHVGTALEQVRDLGRQVG